jgi:sensor histidine kinase regulating citrate/malate metabolism
MIIIDEKIYNSIIVKNEKRILKQQNIAYENQAEIINQSTESIRSLRHDMKNHLIILREIYANDKTDEIEPYIGKILEQMDSRIFSQSNNFVIDSIINFKLRQLKNKDVDITLDINVPQIINILAYDITVILGNLLDNAITAVEQSEKKMLNLSISCNMGNLIILMDNSFNGNLIIENEKFRTTKSFKANHGIGYTNIEKSLENYEGEIRTDYTKDIFSVSIIIPYIY